MIGNLTIQHNKTGLTTEYPYSIIYIYIVYYMISIQLNMISNWPYWRSLTEM